MQPVEPVAGNPHGGFCEGGRAQEVNSFKARPYPPQCWAYVGFGRFDDFVFGVNITKACRVIIGCGCVTEAIGNGLGAERA